MGYSAPGLPQGGDMNSTKKTARLAGVLYLVNGVTGYFSIVYVPSKLIVSGNAAATANNILASQGLFRLGIASELICVAEYVLLLWVLYRLLGGVNKRLALLMVMGALVSLPVQFVNALNEIAALALLRGGDFLSVFGQSQREALALLFLNVHGQVIGLSQTLWVLGLVPFGLLVYRSGFLPRFLGVLLIAAGFGNLAQSLAPFILPSYEHIVSRLANIPTTLGEPAIILWLLIMGAKDRPLEPAA